MRRILPIVLAVLLTFSLAGNGVLGYVAWRAQGEYRALARQFVKVKQEATRAEQQLQALSAQPAATASAAPATPPPQVPAPTPTPAPPSPPATGSSEAVRVKYEPRLLTIQSECEGSLNGLLEQAKADYQRAKTAGGTIDVAALGAKYMARAEGLRRDCDRKVEGTLSAMRADLRAAGLSTDLVDEVRQAYADRIAERQAEIMAKAQ